MKHKKKSYDNLSEYKIDEERKKQEDFRIHNSIITKKNELNGSDELYIMKEDEQFLSIANHYIASHIARKIIGERAPLTRLVVDDKGNKYLASKFIKNFSSRYDFLEKNTIQGPIFDFPEYDNMVDQQNNRISFENYDEIKMVSQYIQHNDMHLGNVGVVVEDNKFKAALVDFDLALRNPGASITNMGDVDPYVRLKTLKKILSLSEKSMNRIIDKLSDDILDAYKDVCNSDIEKDKILKNFLSSVKKNLSERRKIFVSELKLTQLQIDIIENKGTKSLSIIDVDQNKLIETDNALAILHVEKDKIKKNIKDIEESFSEEPKMLKEEIDSIHSQIDLLSKKQKQEYREASHPLLVKLNERLEESERRNLQLQVDLLWKEGKQKYEKAIAQLDAQLDARENELFKHRRNVDKITLEKTKPLSNELKSIESQINSLENKKAESLSLKDPNLNKIKIAGTNNVALAMLYIESLKKDTQDFRNSYLYYMPIISKTYQKKSPLQDFRDKILPFIKKESFLDIFANSNNIDIDVFTKILKLYDFNNLDFEKLAPTITRNNRMDLFNVLLPYMKNEVDKLGRFAFAQGGQSKWEKYSLRCDREEIYDKIRSLRKNTIIETFPKPTGIDKCIDLSLNNGEIYPENINIPKTETYSSAKPQITAEISTIKHLSDNHHDTSKTDSNSIVPDVGSALLLGLTMVSRGFKHSSGNGKKDYIVSAEESEKELKQHGDILEKAKKSMDKMSKNYNEYSMDMQQEILDQKTFMKKIEKLLKSKSIKSEIYKSELENIGTCIDGISGFISDFEKKPKNSYEYLKTEKSDTRKWQDTSLRGKKSPKSSIARK